MMYAVMAIIGRKIPDGSWPLRQVPTFYLDESVQGIVSAEHAEQIAREVIDPFRQYEVHVTVALVDPATPTQDGQAMPLGGSRKTTSSNSLIPSVDPTIEVPATIRRARETLQRLSMREANGDGRGQATSAEQVKTPPFVIIGKVEDPDPPSGTRTRVTLGPPVTAAPPLTPPTEYQRELKQLLLDWIDKSLSHINEYGGSQDWPPLIEDAQRRARILSVDWTPDEMPEYVKDILAMYDGD